MNNPFEIIPWALAIGLAWMVFACMTGLDDWLTSLVGKKRSRSALAAKVEALERRIAQLEAQNKSDFVAK
jgi:hypothetical protein